MQFEVEQKHPLEEPSALLATLAARGVTVGPVIAQTDRYFAHPLRDFARTDEALRIRTVDGASFITYKGPKLDQITKTRCELELPLHPHDADGHKFELLLILLGFSKVGTVHKRRREFSLSFTGRQVKGAVDYVSGLGSFVELEITTDSAGLDDARRVVAALAAELHLAPSERRSYLEMLLPRQS